MINLKLQQKILHLLSTESPSQQYDSCIEDVGRLFQNRFQLTSDIEDIDAAIEYHQVALSNFELKHEDDYALLLFRTEGLFKQRYRVTSNIDHYKSGLQFSLQHKPDPSKPVYGPTFVPHPNATSLLSIDLSRECQTPQQTLIIPRM